MSSDLKKKFNRFLEYDGSLRDILIRDTELTDWKLLYEYLMTSDYKIEYKRDGSYQSLTSNFQQLLHDKEHTHVITIQEENIIFNLHFFDVSEIEIDIDPRDFIADDQYKIIIDLMNNVSRILTKEILLTYENCREEVFYKVG
jgi:hypothetical protein